MHFHIKNVKKVRSLVKQSPRNLAMNTYIPLFTFHILNYVRLSIHYIYTTKVNVRTYSLHYYLLEDNSGLD